MINILSKDIWSDVVGAVTAALRTVFVHIATLIYDAIVVVYDLFIYISRAQFLDNDLVVGIYEKVGMLLGLFMIFKLSFSLIQSLIDPNKFNDKKTGFTQVIYRFVLSIVMLGVVPTIFKEAYSIQNFLVGSNAGGNNVFYKLIIGNSVNGDATSFGKNLAAELYFSFYTDEDEPHLTNSVDFEETEGSFNGRMVERIKNQILTKDGVGFSHAVQYVSLTSDTGEYEVEFNFIFIVLVGGVVLWILAMYCFQVAVRVFQLAYLELIAPIPIFSYISDPDGSFKKWTKQCFSTYFDLFIRLCIIYFIIFLSTYILEQFENSESTLLLSLGDATNNWLLMTFIRVILLVGLLLFAKKLPDLLKDLFPNMGGGPGKFSFGLNPKKELWDPVSKSLPGKVIGAGINKGLGLIDRLAYNTPKPRNKMQQYFDKAMPGRADAIKNRNEIKDRKDLYNEGMEIYSKNGGTLTANDFSNNNYKKSWQAVKNAKDALKTADNDLEYWRNEVAQGRIDTNNSNYQNALKNQKAASARLDAAKRDHDNNRKIYVKDARREDAFGYYKDMQGGASVSTGTSRNVSGSTSSFGSGGTSSFGSGNSQIKSIEKYIGAGDPFYAWQNVTEDVILKAKSDMEEMIARKATDKEIESQQKVIDELIEYQERNLDVNIRQLTDMANEGSYSREEIDKKIEKINQIKPGGLENERIRVNGYTEQEVETSINQLYELIGSGASQEEIEQKMSEINKMKPGALENKKSNINQKDSKNN